MPQPDPQAEQREPERTSLLDVMERRRSFFRISFRRRTGQRRVPIWQRGLTAARSRRAVSALHPTAANALKECLAGKGIGKEQIEACGLVVHGDGIPVSYDRFRDRIMFPIPSAREKVIACGGRAMSPDAPAKYLNSNETELFHKGNVLFNFARARRASQGANGEARSFAVEGIWT